MAERAANRVGVGTTLATFARSLIVLTAIAVGVPWLLMLAARERFGGAGPFHGVPPPVDWRAGRIRDALTDRLTDQTIADVLIRTALVVAWLGVLVLVATVVAEVVHMLRHDGLAAPLVRGFGPTQRAARAIATGLLVVIPLFTSPSAGVAGGHSLLAARSGGAVVSALGVAPSVAGVGPSRADESAVALRPDQYRVRPGDSIFGIAERLAGPETERVAAFAEQIVDLNMGRRMPDGRHFDNAAFIDVGWVLDLPDVAPEPAVATALDPSGHTVRRGESLWSIAADELGDSERWRDIFEINRGRTFADGRRLEDPAVIQPGWELLIPAPDSPSADPAVEPAPPGDVRAEERAATATVVEAGPPASVVDVRDSTAVTDRDRPGDPSAARERGTATDTATATEPARPDNVWDDAPATARPETHIPPQPGAATVVGGVIDDTVDDGAVDDTDESTAMPALIAPGGAAMLSAGVLALLAVRRRRRLRAGRPRRIMPAPTSRSAAIERELRAIDGGEPFTRVATAIRAAALPLVAGDARVLLVRVGPDGALELHATGPADLPAPWEGAGEIWRLAASTPLELIAVGARQVSAPCPALVQLGTDELGRDVYVDLEAAGAIEIGGPGDRADAIVAAIATTLAGSLLAEVTTLVGVGVPDSAFLGHRHHVAATDPQMALRAAAEAIGSTAAVRTSTFALRARASATEGWEPAVVLAGSDAGPLRPPTERHGLAIVSASAIRGPSFRLVPDGDAWVLRPVGLRLTPVGLNPDDVEAVAELLDVDDEPGAPGTLRRPSVDDHTIVPSTGRRGSTGAGAEPSDESNGSVESRDEVNPTMIEPVLAASRSVVGADRPAGERDDDTIGASKQDDDQLVESSSPRYALLVRMIGAVEVADAAGTTVSFERSKSRELVAWLATHRDRSTRSAARTALWELDVRDATFANVVSEARRSLARLVEPPDGEEWVGRTMTDSLPLHELVLSDGDLIRRAVDVARAQPPAQAIATLSPAVELIGGVPFEGTSYLWPDSEGITSDLVLLATTAATELAEHCLSIGDIEGVFRSTGRGLRVLPGHEQLIALRMEAHARSGDHAGVRQEWDSYERVINGDPWSDGEPAPKLVELRQRLLDPSR